MHSYPNLNSTYSYSQSARQNSNQILKAYSFSLDDVANSAKALEAACEPHNGQAPDAVFACAGSSKPGFFVEMSAEDMTQGMVNGYWVQAWTALVIALVFCGMMTS